MFNRKTEKKEQKTQEVDKSINFYDSMIDDIFADSSAKDEAAPRTDENTAPCEDDAYTEDDSSGQTSYEEVGRSPQG